MVNSRLEFKYFVVLYSGHRIIDLAEVNGMALVAVNVLLPFKEKYSHHCSFSSLGCDAVMTIHPLILRLKSFHLIVSHQ